MKKISHFIEGVMIKKLVRYPDERGFFEEIIRLTDPFFAEGFGQLSRSFMHGGVIKAWHIHKTQIDWWYVSRGTLKVALFDERKKGKTYRKLMQLTMGEDGQDVVLKIPPQVAHGLKVISSNAELFYITSKVYNPENEEGRIAETDKEIGFDWDAI